MLFSVRIGTEKQFTEDEEGAVTRTFDSVEAAMNFAEYVVTQGYVAKVGIGNLDG